MNELLREMEVYAQTYNVPIIKQEAADILIREASAKRPLHILEVGLLQDLEIFIILDV